MPGRVHEAIVAFLHDLPLTVPNMLIATGALAPSAHRVVQAQRLAFAEAQPVEARPDLVVICDGEQVLVVEVQRHRDPAKKLAWPVYAVLAYRHFGLPARIVVVTPDAAVAAWAAEPIRFGGAQDLVHPLVLGPDNIPCITDVDQAMANPGAALLSAVVHAESEHAVAAAIAGLYGAATLAPDARSYYNDLIVGLLSDRDQSQLEAAMQQLNSRAPILMTVPEDYKPGDIAREVAIEVGEARGEARGKATAEAQARQRTRQTLGILLARRGLATTPADDARIAASNDAEELLAWVLAAATATDVAQVFAGDVLG